MISHSDMSTHTKEPWITKELTEHPLDWGIYSKDNVNITNITILFESPDMPQEENEANAKRIVACVNACVDVSNEILLEASTNGWAGAWIDINKKLFDAQQQRDKLLEALKISNAYLDGSINMPQQVRNEKLITEIEGKNG